MVCGSNALAVMALRLDRRAFLVLLGGAAVAAGLPACSPPPPLEELAQVLGLRGEEKAWLSDISSRQQRHLYAALTGQDAVSTDTLDLAEAILAARSRLFAYVGYPQVSDRRLVCDGLIRE